MPILIVLEKSMFSLSGKSDQPLGQGIHTWSLQRERERERERFFTIEVNEGSFRKRKLSKKA
jgi:hypothetical protein